MTIANRGRDYDVAPKSPEKTMNKSRQLQIRTTSNDGETKGMTATPKAKLEAKVTEQKSAKSTRKSKTLNPRSQPKVESNISKAESVGNTTELMEDLVANQVVLVMSFIRGSSLFESSTAFEEHGEMIAEELGKIIIFDMVTHNADRLKCKDLEWGGNDDNLLFSFESSTIFCIDSSIPAKIPTEKHQRIKKYYPKFISAILGNSDYASNLLFEVTNGRLGKSSEVDILDTAVKSNATSAVCAAKEDLSSLKVVILPIHEKFRAILDGIAETVFSWDLRKADLLSSNSSSFPRKSGASSIEGAEGLFTSSFTSALKKFLTYAKKYPKSGEGIEVD
ncbi:hypothetical protein OROHE_014753 [Orobanche hederae]